MRFVPFSLVLLVLISLAGTSLAQPAKAPNVDLHGDQLPEKVLVRLGTTRFHPSVGVSAAAVLPDCRVATATGYEKEGTSFLQIDVMETSAGRIARRLEFANVRVPDSGLSFTNISHTRAKFTLDGKLLVLGGWKNVQIVNLTNGRVKTVELENLQTECTAISPDGKFVAAQQSKDVHNVPVAICDLETGKEVATLPGRGTRCKALVFGPNGKRLLLCSNIPNIVTDTSFQYGPKWALACIDVEAKKVVGETTIDEAQFAALSPDGETVAIETADHTKIRVLHLATQAERCVIPLAHAKFTFAPDGAVLFVIDGAGRGSLWNAAKGTRIRDLDKALAHKNFDVLGISKDGKFAAVIEGGWDSDRVVVVWNAATGERVARPPGHEGTVTCLAYAPDGKLLASGSIDRTVRLWNQATGEHVRMVAAHKDEITAVHFSADGKLLASSSKAGVTLVHNVADGKLVAELAGPDKGATALAFSPDHKVLFAGGNSPDVPGWEIASGREVSRLKTGKEGTVMALGKGGSLALNGNGWRGHWDRIIINGKEPKEPETPQANLQIWNTATGKPVASVPIRDKEDKNGDIRCDVAVFSPDGRMIASSQISEYQGIRPSYGNAMLRLSEQASGQPIRTLTPTITTFLAFSPSGRLLASGGTGRSGHLQVGYGGGVDIWDTVTGAKAGSLPVSPVCVAFSPDGHRIATAGSDHAVLIWEAPKIQPSKSAKKASAAEIAALRTALGSEAKEAYTAIAQMLEAPDDAMAFLKEQFAPVKSGDPDDANSPHRLSQCRAVAAVEWIGTAAARDLLRTWADGLPQARLTIEARAALSRQGG